MAKAEPQRDKVVRFDSQVINRGDLFGPAEGPRYRFMDIGGDNLVKVRPVPAEVRVPPQAVGLNVEVENDGVTLHLMQHEAELLYALTELLTNIMDQTCRPAATSALDGTHGAGYWSSRVKTALCKAGLSFAHQKTARQYWQLSDLFEAFYKNR